MEKAVSREEVLSKITATLEETIYGHPDSVKGIMDEVYWRLIRNRLELRVRKQIATLGARGCPTGLLTLLSNTVEKAVHIAMMHSRHAGNIVSVLLVIPMEYLSLLSQMSMLHDSLAKQDGHLGIDPSRVRQHVGMTGPYLLLGTGVATQYDGCAPKDAVVRIKFDEWRPLTITEVIALALHSGMLAPNRAWYAPETEYTKSTADQAKQTVMLLRAGRGYELLPKSMSSGEVGATVSHFCKGTTPYTNTRIPLTS